MNSGLQRYTWRTFAREITLVLGGLAWLSPLYLLVLTSVKPDSQIFSSPTSLPTSLAVGNYSEAWNAADLGHALFNSLVITGGSVALLIAVGSLCAYTIARRPGRWSGLLYLLFVVGIIVPFQLGLIPLYSVMRSLGLVGSYVGIILLYGGLWIPMAVFLYTGFIRAMPKEYEEAALIDGATPFRTFWRVIFPQLRPVTVTVATLCGILVWNDFFTPLVFLSGTDKTPLPLAIYEFVGSVATRWNLVFAGILVALLPVLVLFVLAQRQLMHSFSGGIKS
ncbi:L-arabinose transport system permease protein AraQ [Streptomyces sp. RB17]|uniref:carbohydrate ABC transporter permease n=1 Tax=Streptomyces sp. RB17 TaxID=2585197 RepID=UPI00129702A5|nr:carbohydrate ABC transporter permease [Streptomyces sp. RB17]MQY39941.1 L-arabinose transport system permease protein AraQ [Streptomyces sp. RB17]